MGHGVPRTQDGTDTGRTVWVVKNWNLDNPMRDVIKQNQGIKSAND